VVFRRDSKVDAFQRQISALRNQLGGEPGDFAHSERERLPVPARESGYRTDLPDLDLVHANPSYSAPQQALEPVTYEERAVALPAVPVIDSFTSVIAHTTSWNGNLESTGSLHVHGRVEGSLTARNDIFIAEEAEVDALVQAANVTVAGNVRGSIQCSDRFEILPRGRVAGDIRAPIVVVHEGAMIAGDIVMSPAGEAKTSYAAGAGGRMARGGD
jgi:cytoskeletal protein CcmA (bactofilin family)